MFDVLTFLRAFVADAHHQLADRAHTKAFEFDIVFDPEAKTTEAYAKKGQEADRAQYRLEGAQFLLDTLDQAIRVLRSSNGEEVYKADYDRWRAQMEEAIRHVVGKTARAMALAKGVVALEEDPGSDTTKH